MSCTIAQALQQGTACIGRAETLILLSYVLQKSKTYIIAFDDTGLTSQQESHFHTLVRRRQKGCPVPYLTGQQEFFGRAFHVSPHVLIPRPDTETLIEYVLSLPKPPMSILDLGTGSGCIAITLAKELPQTLVYASDISMDALQIAKENAQRHHANVQFYCGSWWDAIPTDLQVECIISNPPYIHGKDPHLQNLRYEPSHALTDFADGLSCYQAILAQVKKHLLPQGRIIFEHGWDQGKALRTLLCDTGFQKIYTIKDLGNNDRITTGVWEIE